MSRRLTRGSSSSQSDKQSEVKCRKCNKPGHMMSSCPDAKRRVVNSVTLQDMQKKYGPCPSCKQGHTFKSRWTNQDTVSNKLIGCKKFADEMSVEERVRCILESDGCIKWKGHLRKDCSWNANCKECGNVNHHTLLHGLTNALVNHVIARPALVRAVVDSRDDAIAGCAQVQVVAESRDQAIAGLAQVQAAAESKEAVTIGGDEVLLQVQKVKFKQGQDRLVFFDNGSTIVIVRNYFATKLGLAGRRCLQWLQVCGRPEEPWETTVYKVTLMDKDGDEHSMEAYGMEITGDIEGVKIDGVTHHFPTIPAEGLERPYGKVDLLCGINQAPLHPTGGEHPVGNLHLLKSRFGTGWLLDGSHPEIKSRAVKLNKAVHLLKTCSLGSRVWQDESKQAVNYVKPRQAKDPDYIEAEDVDVVIPEEISGDVEEPDGQSTYAGIAVEIHDKLKDEFKPEENLISGKDDAKIVNTINDRPLGMRTLDEEVCQAVTPNILTLGRTSTTPLNIRGGWYRGFKS